MSAPSKNWNLPLEPDRLLAMAGHLVTDPHLAEDIANQAWTRMLPKLRAGAVLSLGYARRVVRNTAQNHLREMRRRQQREKTVARSEAMPSTFQQLAEAELLRVLAEELQRLPEPQGATVRLKYLEGLSAVQIASRRGVPAGTVRSQLKRGLGKLRERLDQRYGSRASWQQAILLGLARRGDGPASAVRLAARGSRRTQAAAPATFVPRALASMAATALVGGAALTAFFLDSPRAAEESRGDSAEPLAGARPTPRASSVSAATLPGLERRPAATGARLAASSRRAGTDDDAVRIRVQSDAGRRDLEAVEVVVAPDPPRYHPGLAPAEQLCRSASSPVRLPRREGPRVQHLLVRSPGHAWTPVSIDRESAGERLVRLPPASELRIELVGRKSAALADLVVRDRVTGRYVVRLQPGELNGRRAVSLPDLPVGSYEVSLERASCGRVMARSGEMYVAVVEPEMFGTVEARTRPGATTTVRLEANPERSAGSDIPVRVRLRIPPNSAEGPVTLALHPLDDKLVATGTRRIWIDEGQRMLGQPEEYLLDLELVAPGAYEFAVTPFLHREIRILEGADTISLDLFPLSDLFLRTDSASFLEPSGLLLFEKVAEEWHPPLSAEFAVDALTGVCRAVLRPGEYLVRPSLDEGLTAELPHARIRLEAPTHEIDLRLELPSQLPSDTTLRIWLKDGGVNVPVPLDLVDVSPVGHDGFALPRVRDYVRGDEPGVRPLSRGYRMGGCDDDVPYLDVRLSQGGLYLVEGFRLSPFAPVDARPVVVAEGGVQELVFALERE